MRSSPATRSIPGCSAPSPPRARCAGSRVRLAPLGELAEAVSADTTLVACSHVSWMSGAFAPAALAEVEVPVLLDGAQGIGAVPVDVGALRCDAYAGPGQKWMCGPDGTGMLYTSARASRAPVGAAARIRQPRRAPARAWTRSCTPMPGASTARA